MNITCNYCSKQAELISSVQIYRKDHGMVWYCKQCDALVHTAQDNKTPLGTLADKELRTWRKRAHELFDQLWKQNGSGAVQKMTRDGAYRLLQQWMGYSTKEQAHIGQFDVDDCKRLVQKLTAFMLVFFCQKN